MVPKEYEGLWRRSGIWRSNGSSDLTTQVWWFQSSHHHIDLRIPVGRVGITAFAGETVVEGERCAWRPAIAYPSIGEELDAGWTPPAENRRIRSKAAATASRHRLPAPTRCVS